MVPPLPDFLLRETTMGGTEYGGGDLPQGAFHRFLIQIKNPQFFHTKEANEDSC